MPPRKRLGKAKVSPKPRKKRKNIKQSSSEEEVSPKSRKKPKTPIQNSGEVKVPPKSRKTPKTTIQNSGKAKVPPKSRKKRVTNIKNSDKKPSSRNAKKRRTPASKHSSKKAKKKKSKAKKHSTDTWKNHHIYPPSVSPQRIVTRSQTGFNRVKKTESNTKLFSTKEKHVVPNCPHLIVSMKGNSGAFPNTIVTRSSGKYYSTDKKLEEKLKLYKSGEGKSSRNPDDEESSNSGDDDFCCIQ